MTLVGQDPQTRAFDELESGVRSYCRQWPAVFERARGAWLYDRRGRPYLDFFAGAGSLNYGHNDPVLKRALIDYLLGDPLVHSLDMFTTAKAEFLVTLQERILGPRGLDYRIQFPGPGGATAVEAALKLARKVTGRTEVVYFDRGFHGMSLGALAVSSNPGARRAAGTPLAHTTAVPYDDGSTPPELAHLERLMSGRGMDRPAAVIVEAVQAEGGINVARPEWLRALSQCCLAHDVLLILDEIQMGCGRTGPFFSFETAGIVPDLVCVSKSISGYGLPLALTLIREELDVWAPGEHSGTFRGCTPAMVTGAAALRTYWTDDALVRGTCAHGERVRAALLALAHEIGGELDVRGRGLAFGFVCPQDGLGLRIVASAFERGLLVETAGPADEVVKLLPPLTIGEDELELGLGILGDAVRAAC